MLQRVQTLYMLSATILTIVLFFKNLMTIGDTSVKFIEYKPFLILTIISLVVALLTFALFTSRILQIRFCIFNMLILLGFQGWIAYMFFTRAQGTIFTIYSVFPIISAILYFIAMKYLAKDEALIQASNSLRDIHKKYKKYKKN